jgi:hypothetical protein
MCLCTRLVAFFGTVVRSWESHQVELQGQYSLARLDELATFMGRTGRLRAVAIAVFTPLTCAATITVVDILPLRPPTKSVLDQNANYWLRLFFTMAVASTMTILNVQYASPSIRIKWAPFAVATTLVTSATTLVSFALHLLIGFPTPFIIQLSTPAWQGFLIYSMWAMWKNTIRANAQVQQDLKQFNSFNLSQFAMAVVYPVLIYVFGTLDGAHQTIFSFAFPVIKFMLKNLASRGVYRREDFAPVFIVLSVDVFHALLLSCTMQMATSRWTVISVMATDVFQSVVAVVEVQTIAKQLERLRGEMSTSNLPMPPVLHGQKTNAVAFTSSILTFDPHIRSDQSIALPRHLRDQLPNSPRISPVLLPPNRITPLAWVDTTEAHATPSIRANVQAITFHQRALHLKYVRLSLQLLHMIEFYVLIEFTEAMVACIYGTVCYVSSCFG